MLAKKPQYGVMITLICKAMSKQTAVEYLIQYIMNNQYFIGNDLADVFVKAKTMEKQQSITDYCEGFKASGEGWNGEYGLDNILDVAGEIKAEDYYNRTYKGGEQ